MHIQGKMADFRKQPDGQWRFADILEQAGVRERWTKVRCYFFLRESTYDMTNRCNIRCNGCYYYEGTKQFAEENRDPGAWRDLMRQEKQRGITFVVLAGAEPSLVPELCEVCHDEVPLGAIATNGLKPLPPSIGYKIHISVWGGDKTSFKTRNARDMLSRQMENYGDDPRAVFVYTFTRDNAADAHEVARLLHLRECRLTFNMFSAPQGYTGELRHTGRSLTRTRETMLDLMAQYPETILFSPYNVVAHTHHRPA